MTLTTILHKLKPLQDSFKKYSGKIPKTKAGSPSWLMVGGIILLLAILLFFTRPEAEVSIAKRGKATSAVYGTVNTEPVTQVIVRSRVSGLLNSVSVRPGQEVKKGDMIAETLDETIQRQTEAARTELEQAKAKRAIGPASQGLLKSKESEIVRLKRLFDAGNIAALEYERAQNELEALRNSVKTETITLESDVNINEQKYKDLSEQVGQLRINSPVTGQVLDVYCNVGEYVNTQAQLVRIGSSQNQIVAQVSEEDIGKLKVGMKAVIQLYPFSGDNFLGTLMETLPQGDNQNYKVIFKLENPPSNLLPGMTGEMNVVIGERENTIIIPTKAIRHGNKVLVVRHGTVYEVPVEIGFKSIEKTEIKSGIEDNDAVIVSDQDKFKTGNWVRTRIAKS
ncbi:MAG: efflux RND transporter periplasmic adaptor subunit [Verrucomicrobiota bacterium]